MEYSSLSLNVDWRVGFRLYGDHYVLLDSAWKTFFDVIFRPLNVGYFGSREQQNFSLGLLSADILGTG